MKKFSSFELSVALRYLLPKKRALSRSLISLMSIGVISLVIWLILLFLSVTNGIEKNWIQKLTALNSPIRIIPTKHYFNSYYYQIDKISSESNYSTKTIREKANSFKTDPYSEEFDMEIPPYWPRPELDKNNKIIDPVKDLYKILSENKNDIKAFDTYEISAALLKLSLERQDVTSTNNATSSYLSQMSYIMSFSDNNPSFENLYLPPDIDDLNNLLKNISSVDYSRFFNNVNITKVIPKNKNTFFIDKEALIQSLGNNTLDAVGEIRGNTLNSIFLGKAVNLPAGYISGKMKNINGKLQFIQNGESEKLANISKNVKISFISIQTFDFKINKKSLDRAKSLTEINGTISGTYKGITIYQKVNMENLLLKEVSPKYSFKKEPLAAPLWVYSILDDKNPKNNRYVIPTQTEYGVLLPKALKDNGVLLGDSGFFSYPTKTTTSMQDQKIDVYVAGFYDPGLFTVGNRSVLVPKSISDVIYSSNYATMLDKISSNGFFIWIKDIEKVDQIKKKLELEIDKNSLSSFWKVETYKDYDFAKDLLEQFQSDKVLFTFLAFIIIIVACSNIISLLILLVNDKKKEIATLQAMGASKKSIAAIFGICGISMGLISTIIGLIAAVLTLKNLDSIASFLSFIQGHPAFNKAFYGSKLPNNLSHQALIFVVIVTPIISFLAGLIPAIKACKINPSQTLRAD